MQDRTGYWIDSYGNQHAETFGSLEQGMKRKRRMQFVSMRTSYLQAKGYKCGVCGGAIGKPYWLNPDGKGGGDKLIDPSKNTKLTYYPKSKTFTLGHYYCSWGALIEQVHELGHRMGMLG